MTKTTKLSIATIVLLALLCSALLLSALPTETAHASSEDIQKCWAAAQNFEDNLPTFIAEYNTMLSDEDEPFNATYIESTKLIRLVEDNNYAVLIDFDGGNGYLVLTGDNIIYGFETDGDAADLLTQDELFYSYYDGFLYKNELGILQELGSSSVRNNDSYSGQTGNGDGAIFDLPSYVAARYPGYTLDYIVNYLDFDFYCGTQQDLSYYQLRQKNASGAWDNSYTPEGNCSLVAMYNVMRNWAQNGFINIPYTTKVNIFPTITSDPLYNTYGRGIEFISDGITYKWETSTSTTLQFVPDVYIKLRNFAINNYGYTPISGFLANNAPATMQTVAAQYGENLSISFTNLTADALASLDQDLAVYMSINGSSSYGDHAVAAMGYTRYKRQTTIGGFTSTDYLYFYEIADGIRKVPQYFDPNTSANPSISYCVLN